MREVVEFVLRAGDLGGGSGFQGSNRAVEGTRGHQRLQRARPAGYEAEVAIKWRREEADFVFELKGRIDGVLAKEASLMIEEIKTTRRGWEGPADPVHLGQAKVYAFLCALERGYMAASVRITYLDLSTETCREIEETFTTAELKQFFEAVTGEYVEWLREHREWQRARDESIRTLGFPFAEYRAGQRKLAVAVYRALKLRSRLFAEAPTGIGKTISVLFPAVKALGEGLVERIFYLTARTVGRVVAEKTLADLRGSGLRLRSVTITAKDKICFNGGQPCDMTACPYAIGYYDRIKAALRDALTRESFTRAEIEAVARKHSVCPFELSLDLSVWVDVVVCDYNYVFDPTVALKRYFDDEKQDYAVLVDEAHNLVDRAREMFSAELHRGELEELRRLVDGPLPRCAKALGKVSREMAALGREENWAAREGSLVSREAPKQLEAGLESFAAEAEKWLVLNEPSEFREALLEGYFRVLAFQRVLDLFDARYASILEPEANLLRLFCVDPAAALNRVLANLASTIFFSATLRPIDFFRQSLGGDALDGVLQLDSPFPGEHLAVLVQDKIATRWRAREESQGAVAEAIGALAGERAGNYLVYFPSYAYLEAVLAEFRAAFPEIPTEVQSSRMNETEREEFLGKFREGGGRTLVAFAVLGGIFGEGIDLIGERLIGVVVVGVGLPQVSIERDLIREYWREQNRSGFDYAYTFPGLNRVLQAVGRVIRSEKDRGVVLLIDDRFGQRGYRALFPGWWQPRMVRSKAEIAGRAREFWG